jgi:hypothetical protein
MHLPREKRHRIVGIALLVDHIIYASMAEAVCQGEDRRFTEAMYRLSDVHFVNLIVDAATIDQLMLIPCLVTNPHAAEQSGLLALRGS